MRTTQFSGRLYRGGGYVSLWVKMGVYQPPFTTTPFHPLCTEWLTDRCKNITFP